jgi:hypothetical protein
VSQIDDFAPRARRRARHDHPMHLPAAAASLDRLVALTAPGAAVAPVIEELATVDRELQAARPALEQARASAYTLGQLDRVQGMATQLGSALAQLVREDGMTTFDPAFAADDAEWDATFREHAEIVRRAATLVSGDGSGR